MGGKVTKKPTPIGAEMTKKMVLEYLEQHPEFLKEHPEVFVTLLPPEAKHGNGVVDLQQYILGNLRKDLRELKERHDGLIVASRDNMSTQGQVHHAVLSLMRANDLEHLLEILTTDLVHWFDVDVIRLGLESDLAERGETFSHSHTPSGLVFVPPGTVTEIFAGNKTVALFEDVEKGDFDAFPTIFSGCTDLARSVALLYLELPSAGRDAILAFGVRHPDRFHAGQGTELLSFLARITEYKLDTCLKEVDTLV